LYLSTRAPAIAVYWNRSKALR